MSVRLVFVGLAVAMLLGASGCGGADATNQTAQDDTSSGEVAPTDGAPREEAATDEAGEGESGSVYPQGLCKAVPAAAVASGLGIAESDVGPCDVVGGDPSPAAGANLHPSGIYELYTLYLTPDEEGSLWELASQGANLYEFEGRQCFSSLNRASGSESASVQCSNPAAGDVVTFSLIPTARTKLPADAPRRAEAVAKAVFPDAFAYAAAM